MPEATVSNIQPIDHMTLKATFTVELPGVGRINGCRYVEAKKGPFVSGPTYRDRYATGGWAEPVMFEPGLAALLLATVGEQLSESVSCNG